MYLSIQADTPIEKAQLVCHNDTMPQTVRLDCTCVRIADADPQ